MSLGLSPIVMNKNKIKFEDPKYEPNNLLNITQQISSRKKPNLKNNSNIKVIENQNSLPNNPELNLSIQLGQPSKN